MKPLRKHLKGIALFLATIFLLQSCSVYSYEPSRIDEAVNDSNKGVKVKSENNETYIFTDLEKIGEDHFGIALKNSKTAKKLSGQITYEDEFEYVKILLKKEQLNKVYVKKYNNTLSTILTYVALSPILATVGFAIAMY